jgi:hypothetical protein
MIAIVGKIDFVEDVAFIHFPHRKFCGTLREIIDKAESLQLDYVIPDKKEIRFVPKNSAKLVKSPVIPDSWSSKLNQSWK